MGTKGGDSCGKSGKVENPGLSEAREAARPRPRKASARSENQRLYFISLYKKKDCRQTLKFFEFVYSLNRVIIVDHSAF
ncbi:hypothetical protein ABD91_21800 [Lysinibacillus sphaericus]|nr:hypothetical protein [Lysinibacillus sphaericus]